MGAARRARQPRAYGGRAAARAGEGPASERQVPAGRGGGSGGRRGRGEGAAPLDPLSALWGSAEGELPVVSVRGSLLTHPGVWGYPHWQPDAGRPWSGPQPSPRGAGRGGQPTEDAARPRVRRSGWMEAVVPGRASARVWASAASGCGSAFPAGWVGWFAWFPPPLPFLPPSCFPLPAQPQSPDWSETSPLLRSRLPRCCLL